MATVLLDTTVASLLHPRKKDSAARAFFDPHLRDSVLALSFQTVAELWQWAEENNWGEKRREELETMLRRFLVVPFDSALARAWASIRVRSKRIGRRLEAGDAWIAATAYHHGLRLLTTDGDFVDLQIDGLDVLFYKSDEN